MIFSWSMKIVLDFKLFVFWKFLVDYFWIMLYLVNCNTKYLAYSSIPKTSYTFLHCTFNSSFVTIFITCKQEKREYRCLTLYPRLYPSVLSRLRRSISLEVGTKKICLKFSGFVSSIRTIYLILCVQKTVAIRCRVVIRNGM